MPPTESSVREEAGTFRAGLGYSLGAYGLWGVLPVYFFLLAPAGPFEIVGWRILFSLVFCALLLTVTRTWRRMGQLLRSPRTVLLMGLAAACIYANWTVYVYATTTGHVVEGALGYFINPILTVLLGVVVLRERLRPAQWAAVGLSVVAVLVIAVGYGVFPWMALTLAVSFATYGLVKKLVGGRVDAVTGLALETAWLTPVAAAQLAVLGTMGAVTFASEGTGHALLLAASGVITAVPLLLFAAGARRLPLTVMGLTQYIAPLLQFLFGVLILHEAMPVSRWIGFSIVWVALVVLTVDMFAANRAPRREALEPA
ncbi:EamA family transporter RarD [Desertivibrio insolitus]|uniref:EamA family transporter RarD n=1 Tax=Herbiconiux sp. SYSU D00978 TaxID=2812562 RepID=UPI001A972BB5|nr:EamA family transporter RarD [Herbiconiux sp. SYSU D00978]